VCVINVNAVKLSYIRKIARIISFKDYVLKLSVASVAGISRYVIHFSVFMLLVPFSVMEITTVHYR
jgi:uncharacterized protein YbcV (DUF1398 family)